MREGALWGGYGRRLAILIVACEQVACSSGVMLSDANIRRLAGHHHVQRTARRTHSCRSARRCSGRRAGGCHSSAPRGDRGMLIKKMGQFFVDAPKAIWAASGNPQKIAKRTSRLLIPGRYRSLRARPSSEIATISGQRTPTSSSSRRRRSEFGRGRTSLNERGSMCLGRCRARLTGSSRANTSPTTRPCILDQRYIDYLARTARRCGRCTGATRTPRQRSFSGRQKYEVDLGPGTKDGGVDVRVWTDKEAKAGPPLMLIQCKRTKDTVASIR